MRILGIDPGLNTTGYGLIEAGSGGIRLIEGGVVRGGRGTLPRRVAEIYRGVAEVIESHSPEILAIEELYSHYERPRTAILMGHARGAIILAAELAGIEVRHFAATRIKKVLTGNGRAPKAQMQRVVTAELHLTSPPNPPDVADALAIALSCWYLNASQQALGRTEN